MGIEQKGSRFGCPFSILAFKALFFFNNHLQKSNFLLERKTITHRRYYWNQGLLVQFRFNREEIWNYAQIGIIHNDAMDFFTAT